jgi:tRNA(Ile)-lysidine synthase
VPAAERDGEPIADQELASFFSELTNDRRVLLAVSGGPDSTALLILARRWSAGNRKAPELVAATVDHRLRPEARREAEGVAVLASQLGVPHHILVWSGKKPSSGLQEAAREARYGLLARLARRLGADAIVTAHTLDDQAETLLMRMARGSGLTGLGGIRRTSERQGLALLRPLLDVPKGRLIATLQKARIPFAEDSSNTDPKFARVRLRKLAADLAAEGLTPARLSLAARRLARADSAIEAVADELQHVVGRDGDGQWPVGGPMEFNPGAFFKIPEEISVRLLGRAIERAGDEGPVELAKLETIHAALASARRAGTPLRRTLAGAVVSLDRSALTVARAPRRRSRK